MGRFVHRSRDRHVSVTFTLGWELASPPYSTIELKTIHEKSTHSAGVSAHNDHGVSRGYHTSSDELERKLALTRVHVRGS